MCITLATQSPIADGLELAVGTIAGNQPLHLGPAQAGHLFQVAAHQAAPLAALLLIVPLAQQLLHPVVNLPAILTFEPDVFAGFEKSLDLLQVQLLGFVHAGGQSSACHRTQAHLVLEETPGGHSNPEIGIVFVISRVVGALVALE